MRNRFSHAMAGVAVMAAGIGLAPSPVTAQAAATATATADTMTVYKREVFTYTAAGLPDPFRSLLNTAELGVRFEDLTLQGIMYHPNPARSVAILAVRGSPRRIQARVGERIGGLTITAISPRAIQVLIEEFGVARRETMELMSVPSKGGTE